MIRVSCQGSISSPPPITAGVSQGSVLSGLLFLIFINDIVERCQGCDVALFADDIAVWPHQQIQGKKQVVRIQLENSLRNLSQWASDWRMVFNVKKSCVVLFRNTTRKTGDHSDPSSLKFSLSGQQLPVEPAAKYLGVMLHSNGRWDKHFDTIIKKVRYTVHRICRIIHKGQHPTLHAVCELIKTQVHPIISYGFPTIKFTETQIKRLDSLMLLPIKRSLSAFATTSHAALFLTSKLLDVHALWNKKCFSYAHRLHRQLARTSPASKTFRKDLSDVRRGLLPRKAPDYTMPFAAKLDDIEKQFEIRHDEHFTAQDIKRSAAMDTINRMIAQNPHSPFTRNYNPHSDHPTRLDHHLRADPPTVIILRSRLRLSCTHLNSPLFKRKRVASPACPHCDRPETIEHVLLHCPHYHQARLTFFNSIGHKPPDADVILICLARTATRGMHGRKQTIEERCSATYLLEIDKLRPDL
jgi:Reverse transcriptase (RNA-dependent DNA polymerase)